MRRSRVSGRFAMWIHTNEVAALPSRQRLKKAPRLRVGFDCLCDVARQLGNGRLRRILVCGAWTSRRCAPCERRPTLRGWTCGALRARRAISREFGRRGTLAQPRQEPLETNPRQHRTILVETLPA